MANRRTDLEYPDYTKPTEDAWRRLQKYTTARIGLGHAGVSHPTRHHLNFQLDHARARDAVHSELDMATLLQDLKQSGYDPICLHSQAVDRRTYLQRPDLGRRLDEASRERLQKPGEHGKPYDVAFIIADGLSAFAVQQHAVKLINQIVPLLQKADWAIAPVTVVEQARVAISDEIGSALGAQQAVILLGERPGLSSPDSLGVYLTYQPQMGRTDAERNCISNIRAAGLGYQDAAHKLSYLLSEARRRKLSGVRLKDESKQAAHADQKTTRSGRNFLLE